jgi:hypothetical protein
VYGYFLKWFEIKNRTFCWNDFAWSYPTKLFEID